MIFSEKVGVDLEEDNVLFIWPMTVVHKITRDSPLYKISAYDLLKEKFEIVVCIEGVAESTNMTTQARSSYLPTEILWGHRFEPLICFSENSGQHQVNFSVFHNTYEVNTPLCSSCDLDKYKKLCQDDESKLIV